jgi:hypothetical protein
VVGLKAGILESPSQCTGKVRVGEPLHPCRKEPLHPLVISCIPDDGIPVSVEDERASAAAEDPKEFGECGLGIGDVLVDLSRDGRVEGLIFGGDLGPGDARPSRRQAGAELRLTRGHAIVDWPGPGGRRYLRASAG